MLPEFARKQGYTIIGEYKDEGISGATIEKRPDFKRLLLDIDKGLFNILIAYDVDRLTRSNNDLNDIFTIMNSCKKNGVIIQTHTGGQIDLNSFDGTIVAFIKLLTAGQQKKTFLERCKFGKYRKLSEGKWPFSHSPFGYKWDGKMFRKVPEEIEVFNKIKDMVLNEHLYVEQIAEGLNKEKL